MTTKGRYAVTAVMDLALHQTADQPVTLAEIAARQGIPQPYLGRLFAQMHRRGLLDSHRGPCGGYTLRRAAEDICLADVLDAVDEGIDTMRCGGRMNCQDNKECLTHAVWEKLGARIRRMLLELSLADLAADLSVRRVAERQLHDWHDAGRETNGETANAGAGA